MRRRLALLLLLSAAGCTKRDAPATMADDSTRTSVGMGGPQLVTRFVGTWERPVPGHPTQREAMTLAPSGALTFSNVCTQLGVSWAELPGSVLSLTARADTTQPAQETRFHILVLDNTTLLLKGDGYLSGRWTRAASAVQDSCASR